MIGLIHLGFLTGLVYLSVSGLFVLWWVYAAYVARLVFIRGPWIALLYAMSGALLAAVLQNAALPQQSMAFGIFRVSMWYALPTVLLAWVLEHKRSGVWFFSTLFLLIYCLGLLIQPTGLGQAVTWQYFADTFAHQGHSLFQGAIAWFADTRVVHWMLSFWLPFNGALLCLAVLLAWYSVLITTKSLSTIDWSWSREHLGLLWMLILLPQIVPVHFALEASSMAALGFLVAMGLFGLMTGRVQRSLNRFVKYASLCAWMLIIVLWQWAIWVFAGFGSLVLWREGFNHGSNST